MVLPEELSNWRLGGEPPSDCHTVWILTGACLPLATPVGKSHLREGANNQGDHSGGGDGVWAPRSSGASGKLPVSSPSVFWCHSNPHCSACVHAQSFSHVWLFWDPKDCSPPGSSVHGISQARMLEWVAMPSSKGSSRPSDQTLRSCTGRWVLHHCTTCEA